MKKIIIPLFFLMVLIQWLVPAQMIWKKENILVKGKAYKFRTAPVDPYDPFIGRYITLNFEDDVLTIPSKEEPKNTDLVYITFKNDSEGFAQIDRIFEKAPKRDDYLETSVYEYGSDSEGERDSITLRVDYKFNKFYMEESKAPEAESIYGNSNIDSSAKVYALVSLYNGDAVIKNVYVNDTTISDMIRKSREIRID